MTLLDQVISGASGDTSVATLLRQVKVLSSRTQTAELASWVDQELNGYRSNDGIPAYRGPFGLVPLGHFIGPFGSEARNVQIPRINFPAEYRDGHLFNVIFHEPIAEIEVWAASDGMGVPWSPDTVRVYNHLVSTGEVSPVVITGMVLAEVHCPVPGATFVGILDAVRNKVLDLALELERVAPMAGQPDSPPEQQGPAAAVINNHFHGSSNVSIGSRGTSQVVVNLPGRDDAQGLLRFLAAAGVAPSQLQELEQALQDDAAEAGHEGSGSRWRRSGAWLARAATDTTTGALGGAIVTATASFLGG